MKCFIKASSRRCSSWQLFKNEAGNPQLAIDDYGDCNDVFQLVTGRKTLPQDKSQCIYVLSLRESRLAGCIRWMILAPTRFMAAGALTKPMLSKQMMMVLTSGFLEMQNKETHHIQMKRLPPKYEIEEQDLETEDHVLIQKFESETINPENLWWTPMFAAGDMSNHGSPDNFLFYALAFFTVDILVFERLAMQLGSRFLDWIRTVISRQSSLSLPRLRLDQIRALWQARALAWHTHQQPRNPKQYKPLNRRPIVCGPDTICHSQVHLPVWSSGTNRWNKN